MTHFVFKSILRTAALRPHASQYASVRVPLGVRTRPSASLMASLMASLGVPRRPPASVCFPSASRWLLTTRPCASRNATKRHMASGPRLQASRRRPLASIGVAFASVHIPSTPSHGRKNSHSVEDEGVGERIDAQDVDLECLRVFERKLFVCSREEGEASYNQWGLDAGEHQYGWDPYRYTPHDWDDGWTPEDSEALLEVSSCSVLSKWSAYTHHPVARSQVPVVQRIRGARARRTTCSF